MGSTTAAEQASPAAARVDALLDAGTFTEYGALTRPDDPRLVARGDGVVVGTGAIHGRAVAVAAYDFSVLAGSQGIASHRKVDRILRLAGAERWPVVLLLEGAGARAHEMSVSNIARAGAFVTLARLSGRVPIVGAVVGPSFAGQANLAALCDVIVAVRGATMGMAGPPLVAARLGRQPTPDEIGAMAVHERSGAVDLVVDDVDEALAAVRRVLGAFAPEAAPVPAPEEDIGALVPSEPRRAYDMRRVIEALCDAESVLELRPAFGRAAITALARIEGRAVGVVASQPKFGAGAIDTPAADKIARFVDLCSARGLPLLFLVDTPGFLVGPDVESTALTRHSARMLSSLAHAGVPILTVVLRKAYGLGFYAMGSPAFDPVVVLEWPTAEYGGMGLDGAVRIVHREALEASERPQELHAELVARLRAEFTAERAAETFSVDALVEPSQTREVLARALATLPPRDGRADRPVTPW